MSSKNKPDLRFGISIAGIETQLAFYGGSLVNEERIRHDYASFEIDEHVSAPTITINIEEGEEFPLNPSGSIIQTQLQFEKLFFVSAFEKGWFDLSTKNGELVIRPAGSPENFLRVLYALRCLEQGAILLHASGIVHEGIGYVFFGPSGSGKTTITILSPGKTILSDDLVIMKYESNGIQPHTCVFGVPFRGELVNAPRTNMVAPLKKIFILFKDQVNRIEPVSETEVVARLAACVPFVMYQPRNARRVLELCQKIVQNVQVSTLHFCLDSEFWSLIDG